LLKAGNPAQLVTVLGLTFKENVVDVRNSQVFEIIRELRSFGIEVQVHDPIADPRLTLTQYGVALQKEPKPADALIIAVAHDAYRKSGWPFVVPLLKEGRGLVLDVKGILDLATRPPGVEMWRL
jgi:UDP-N-acetyl-D-galactosamine dehydrogenase